VGSEHDFAWAFSLSPAYGNKVSHGIGAELFGNALKLSNEQFAEGVFASGDTWGCAQAFEQLEGHRALSEVVGRLLFALGFAVECSAVDVVELFYVHPFDAGSSQLSEGSS
jgi:hypothetical protein